MSFLDYIVLNSTDFWARYTHTTTGPVVVQARIAGFWTRADGRVPYITVPTPFGPGTINISISDYAAEYGLHLLPKLYTRKLSLFLGQYQDSAKGIHRAMQLTRLD